MLYWAACCKANDYFLGARSVGLTNCVRNSMWMDRNATAFRIYRQWVSTIFRSSHRAQAAGWLSPRGADLLRFNRLHAKTEQCAIAIGHAMWICRTALFQGREHLLPGDRLMNTAPLPER